MRGEASELSLELVWIDPVFEYFDAIYEHDRYVIPVPLKGARVLIYIDFAKLEVIGAARREDGRFGFLAKMTAWPAVDNDDGPVHKEVKSKE